MKENFLKKIKNSTFVKSKAFKIIFFALIGVVVIVAALIATRMILNKNKTDSTTYTVQKEVYENAISVAGVVSAAQKQKLQALSSGTVVAVYAKQGDTVKEGDVILQMDATTEQYNLAKHDYDMETTRVTGSQRQYNLMQTQRLSLVQKVAERKVTATFDGIIADIDVAVGDSLEAKDSVGTLVDVSYLIADVEVAETDVAKLQIGQEVEFTFPAYNGKVKGYVVGWPAIGEVTSRGATVVKVRLRIDEYPVESILPNFSFSGEIKIAPDETYLLVERYAVGREGKQAFVVKAKSDQKEFVKVEPYSGEYVKIVEGDVSEGDVLKAQSTPKTSGGQRKVGANAGPGMGGMGGGMSGPPPMR